MRRKIDKNRINKNKLKENNMQKGLDIVNEHNEELETSRKRRIGKTKEDIIDENKLQKSKKKNLVSFLICFFVIIIVFLIYILIEYGPLFGLTLKKDADISSLKKIDIVSTDQDIYKAYNSNLIFYSAQTISMYNSNTHQTFSYKLPEAFNPIIYNSNNYMLVLNSEKGMMYLFSNKTEILDKKIDGKIIYAYVDDSGNFAIEYSSNEYKKIIGVFNKNGDNLYNVYLDSNAIIDIKLLDSGEKLIVAQTLTDSLSIGVSIKEIDGIKDSNNIKEIVKLDNTMLYNLTISGQNIIMLLDNGIKSYDMNTTKLNTIKSFDKLQASFIDINSNYYSIVEDNSTLLDGQNQKYLLESNRFDGNNISSLNLDNVPKYIESSNILVALVYQDKIEVVNKWGSIVKNLSISFPPKQVILFNNEKSLALVYSNKIYILNI